MDNEFKPDNFCECKPMRIFDLYPTDYPKGYDRCRKCSKVVDKVKQEYILNNPL